jgi:UDP-N-acetylglucosamine 2-epimerase (non-hydrolysing)
LRTGDLGAPWPEELNRRVASLTAALHCAPTPRARASLLAEGVPDSAIHVTGNTVIDALLWTVARERERAAEWERRYAWLDGQRLVLVTGHRRESFGAGMREIAAAIGDLAARFPDARFVYPVHLNPSVQGPIRAALGGKANVHLLDPVPYPEFVWLMDRSTLIVTDSGGVQEEAPSLKKPVIVMRDSTERPEAVEAGAAELVGTSRDRITAAVTRLLTDPAEYARRQPSANPYGDGRSAPRILDLILAQAWA